MRKPAPKYSNIRGGDSWIVTRFRFFMNIIRTWYKFHLLFPWVKYNGFVRVMPGVSFAKGIDVQIGHNVQFGRFCDITTPTHFGNNILLAGGVSIVGRQDHTFNEPTITIWDGKQWNNKLTIIEDDVWIGTGAIILSGIIIGRGSIVAAGSVVTKSIPPCEIWGGNPAHKLKDRFLTESEKEKHIAFLRNNINEHFD